MGLKVKVDGKEIPVDTEINNLGVVYTFDTEAGKGYVLQPEKELPYVIMIEEDNAELFVKDELQLTIVTNYENKEDIIWTSSNEKIAQVENGKVIPKMVDEVTITASLKGVEQVFDTCTINIVGERMIPSSQLTAVADSEENAGKDGPASYAVDGNEGSFWHTAYSGNKVKPDITNNERNSITIDLGGLFTISKI